MPKPLPPALQERVCIHLDQGDSIAFIHSATGVSVIQIKKMSRNCLRTGAIALPPPGPQGRPLSLTEFHAQEILGSLQQKPLAYQNEMAWFLFDEFEIIVDRSTVSRTLQRCRWSRKAAKRQAAQRNEVLRLD